MAGRRGVAEPGGHGRGQAQDYLCWISLEAFDDKIDKKCLIGPTPRAVELAERVRQQVANFGLTIDLSHLPLLKESPSEFLIHAHAGNCMIADTQDPAYGDMHPRLGYPGRISSMNPAFHTSQVWPPVPCHISHRG